jgi:hypothetical protein
MNKKWSRLLIKKSKNKMAKGNASRKKETKKPKKTKK